MYCSKKVYYSTYIYIYIYIYLAIYLVVFLFSIKLKSKMKIFQVVELDFYKTLRSDFFGDESLFQQFLFEIQCNSTVSRGHIYKLN